MVLLIDEPYSEELVRLARDQRRSVRRQAEVLLLTELKRATAAERADAIDELKRTVAAA